MVLLPDPIPFLQNVCQRIDDRQELGFVGPNCEIYSETVGVNEMVETESVVYPNPANNEINVSVENMTKVTVYNSIGQMVFAQDASSDVMTISTESMTNGIYYVTIETAEGATSTQKIVVSK